MYIRIYYLCIVCMVKYKILLGNIHTKLMILLSLMEGTLRRGWGYGLMWLLSITQQNLSKCIIWEAWGKVQWPSSFPICEWFGESQKEKERRSKVIRLGSHELWCPDFIVFWGIASRKVKLVEGRVFHYSRLIF